MRLNVSILGDIFKSIGISKPYDFAAYLYTSEEYGTFDKMCKDSLINNQKGGAKYTLNYEGIDFEFTKYRDMEHTMYGLYSSRRPHAAGDQPA